MMRNKFSTSISHIRITLKKLLTPILSIAKYVYNIPSNFRVSTMKYRFRLQKGVKFSFFMSLHPLKCISIHVWRLSVLESHRSKVDDSFQYSMFWCCFEEIFPGPELKTTVMKRDLCQKSVNDDLDFGYVPRRKLKHGRFIAINEVAEATHFWESVLHLWEPTSIHWVV